MTWLGRGRNIRQKETGARPFQSEDFIEVRTLVVGCSASLIFQLLPLNIRFWLFIIKTN